MSSKIVNVLVFDNYEEAEEFCVYSSMPSKNIFYEIYRTFDGYAVLQVPPKRIYTVGEVLEDGSTVVSVSYDGTECLVSYGD